MSNTLYHYHDSDFNLDDANNCTLLLLSTADLFSAAVIKAGRLMTWVRDCPTEQLLSPGDDLSNLLGASYAQVITGVESTKFTLWPESIYQPQQTPAIARLLNVEATESVFTDQLDAQNTIVYAVAEDLTRALNNHNLESQAVFGAKGWIKAIASNSPSDQSIYLNVHKQWVDVLCFQGNKIRLYNKFRFSHAEELVYYTLLTAQELNLDLKTIAVNATGDIQPADSCISRLAEFFKSAQVMDLKVISLPAEVQAPSILALSALSLCVSLAEA